MKYLIQTFGCRTNQAESFELEKQLHEAGFRLALGNEEPDVVILNSCAVTLKAVKEVRQSLSGWRRQYSKAKLVLMGCVVNFGRLTERFLTADLVIANEEKGRAVELIISQLGSQGRVSFADDDRFGSNFSDLRGLVKIQDGCNNFCAYCIVPYLRRSICSVSIEDVVEKTLWLIRNRQAREVNLTGINLELYRPGLVQLLETLLKKTRIERIRFGSINVGAFSDDFFGLYAREYRFRKEKTRLARHFHIPLQSGSDRILRRMNRPYSVSQYLALVEKIRAAIPGVTITTDVIVGFPGETDDDFQATLEVIEKAGFLKVHLFRYSNRPGTLASRMLTERKWQRVSGEEKRMRAKEAAKIAAEVSQRRIELVAKEKYLVIPEAEIEPGVWIGYTDNFLRRKVKI